MLPLMWMPGTMEWFVILLVALLIWGHKLPNIARSLGSSVNEFKKGAQDGAATQSSEAPPSAAHPTPPAPAAAQTTEKK